MKQIISLNGILVLFLSFSFSIVFQNCKNESSIEKESSETEIKSEEEIVPEVSILSPENIDLNNPIPVAELKEAFYMVKKL